MDLPPREVVLDATGNGGKAQSMFNEMSGEGGFIIRGIGLVALLFILNGGLPWPDDSGEGLLLSL